MKILVVGNGGREHALLWKLQRDAPDARFWITRGNGGTGGLATPLPLDSGEIPALAGWAENEGIDLVVVGPEAPLASGIVDYFLGQGIAAFGPSHAAAEIESSKAWAKALMARHGIPTAAHASFDALAPALAHLGEVGAPVVVKASGLAAGKGAVVCQTEAEARDALGEMLGRGALGDAGREVVIEEFREGEELSVFALSDGEHVVPMLPAQDHKRVGEGEAGPNTGGMGAYAPVSLATPALLDRVQREILQPTVAAMAEEDRAFRGLLYAGLMLTADGPKVVEFNCRFGDPETQAILPLLSSSLLDPLWVIANGGSIAGLELAWRDAAAVTTVLASGGYPGEHAAGTPVHIAPEVRDADDLLLFHAGTAERDGTLLTSGGRVLAVTALAPTIAQAAERSRWGAERITFGERHFRRDIGWREIDRQA
ncbi:phosphoribosylamine--glycine ligase [soil metagenome]